MTIAGLDLTVRFAAGEEMRTEISAKFRPDGLTGELTVAGLRLLELWTDPGGRLRPVAVDAEVGAGPAGGDGEPCGLHGAPGGLRAGARTRPWSRRPSGPRPTGRRCGRPGRGPTRTTGGAGHGPGPGRQSSSKPAPPSATSTMRTSLGRPQAELDARFRRQARMPHAVGHQLADQQLGVLRHQRIEIGPQTDHGVARHARRHWRRRQAEQKKNVQCRSPSVRTMRQKVKITGAYPMDPTVKPAGRSLFRPSGRAGGRRGGRCPLGGAVDGARPAHRPGSAGRRPGGREPPAAGRAPPRPVCWLPAGWPTP